MSMSLLGRTIKEYVNDNHREWNVIDYDNKKLIYICKDIYGGIMSIYYLDGVIEAQTVYTGPHTIELHDGELFQFISDTIRKITET